MKRLQVKLRRCIIDASGNERKALAAFVILLLLMMLFIPGLSHAEDSISALEMQLLGKKMNQLPMDQRIHNLEKILKQPELPKMSTQYRKERLYATNTVPVTEQNRQKSVTAYNSGVDAAEQGDFDRAVHEFRKAIQLNPGFIHAYNNLGSLLERMHQYDEAIKVYTTAIQQDAADPMLHRNLGVVYEKTGNVEEALREYRQYLKLSPQPEPSIAAIVHNYDAQKQKAQNAPDYALLSREGSEGKLLLWSKRINPIPVYIRFDPDQTAFLPAIMEGLQQWEEATGGRIRFTEVNLPAHARIVIMLREGPLSHPYLDVGHASFDVKNEASRVPDMRVTIKVNTGERDLPISLENRLLQVRRLALHEIGHAIGIWGHSPDPGDIMYQRPIASKLSERDIRTIRRLYAENPTP